MLEVNATDFKATCLDLLDRVADGRLDRVVITKRGKTVGVLVPPDKQAAPDAVFGCMAGSVRISTPDTLVEPASDPASDDEWDAARGILHR